MLSAYAEEVVEVAEVAQNPNGLASFIPLVLIFVIFYFFIIRPQSKKQKEQQELISSVKKGDKVVYAGGLIGKIAKIKDETIVEIEISKGVTSEVMKSSITSLASDTKKSK